MGSKVDRWSMYMYANEKDEAADSTLLIRGA